MNWCDLPLSYAPKLVQVARATHGNLAEQSWIVEDFWAFHLYDYAATLWVDGQETHIRPGYAGFTPPAAVAKYRFQGPSTHLYAHLRWSGGSREQFPLTFDVGASFDRLWAAMDEAVGFFSTDPLRAEVRVWDVLLTATAAREPNDPTMHPAVRQTLAAIDQRLAERLSVAELADAAFVSHNQLTRLFRQTTGMTVIEAIQERRMERARHLLQHSTMPVKQVATLVGLPDLQQFNKAVRKRFGLSPTAMRSVINR